MQLVLHDCLFIVIFNSLVGYSQERGDTGEKIQEGDTGRPLHHTLMYRIRLVLLNLHCLLRGSLGHPPETEVDQHF